MPLLRVFYTTTMDNPSNKANNAWTWMVASLCSFQLYQEQFSKLLCIWVLPCIECMLWLFLILSMSLCSHSTHDTHCNSFVIKAHLPLRTMIQWRLGGADTHRLQCVSWVLCEHKYNQSRHTTQGTSHIFIHFAKMWLLFGLFIV